MSEQHLLNVVVYLLCSLLYNKSTCYNKSYNKLYSCNNPQ